MYATCFAFKVKGLSFYKRVNVQLTINNVRYPVKVYLWNARKYSLWKVSFLKTEHSLGISRKS